MLELLVVAACGLHMGTPATRTALPAPLPPFRQRAGPRVACVEDPVGETPAPAPLVGLLARVPLVCGPVVQHAAAADGPAVKVRVGV